MTELKPPRHECARNGDMAGQPGVIPYTDGYVWAECYAWAECCVRAMLEEASCQAWADCTREREESRARLMARCRVAEEDLEAAMARVKDLQAILDRAHTITHRPKTG